MATPSLIFIKSAQDYCVLCAFSFVERFINEKGKLVSGMCRKRRLLEKGKLEFYAKSDLVFQYPTSICIICSTLLDQGIRAQERLDSAKKSVALKLSNLPHPKRQTQTIKSTIFIVQSSESTISTDQCQKGQTILRPLLQKQDEGPETSVEWECMESSETRLRQESHWENSEYTQVVVKMEKSANEPSSCAGSAPPFPVAIFTHKMTPGTDTCSNEGPAQKTAATDQLEAEPLVTYKCSVCDFRSDSKDALVNHIIASHTRQN